MRPDPTPTLIALSLALAAGNAGASPQVATWNDHASGDWMPEGLGGRVVEAESGLELQFFESCYGDVDVDGAVGVADLVMVLVNWGPCADPDECASDPNGDGEVDVQDLVAVIAAWGDC